MVRAAASTAPSRRRGADSPVDPRVRVCRRMVSRRALVGASVSLLPVPGLDLAVDVALLARLINEINLRFGLSPAQIEALSPRRKALVYRAITGVGSSLIGQAVKRGLILQVLKSLGLKRLGATQAARWVPVAGQVLTATLSYLAMRHLLYRHIDDCAAVGAQLALAPP